MTEKSQLVDAPLDAPWLGPFSSGHLPFTIDQLADPKLIKQVPTLAEMTRLALKKLGREDRFILQVEGGRVDHAAHSNDIATAVRELVAFDEALEACLEFQAREPEVLLVITTDHGTGNAGLNSSGGVYSESAQPLFDNVRKAKASFELLGGKVGSNPAPGKIQSVIAEATGYKLPDRKAALMASFFEKKGVVMYDAMNSVNAQMGQLMANRYGVGWTSGEHTADYVPLLSLGPGATRFRGFVQNTEVFANYLALAGIDFRNPHAPLMAECGPSASETERAEMLA
jgi:alkaline phosphatase